LDNTADLSKEKIEKIAAEVLEEKKRGLDLFLPLEMGNLY